jgi:putative molybdopterin biosynthesis protein
LRKSVYLDNVPLTEAMATFRRALVAADRHRPLGKESLALADGGGRALADPVYARASSPAYHAAAMDGYAVRAASTRGASETTPLQLVVGQTALPIDTGAPLPPDCDAVIMLEDAVPEGDAIVITAAAPRWQHVRSVGEDVVAGQLLYPANHTLNPADLAVLASAGVAEVAVWRRPLVAIIPSGDELIALGSPGSLPVPTGKILESNSFMLAGLVRELGGVPDVQPPVADDPRSLAAAVDRAIAGGADLIVVNAGSSAGSRDFTAQVARQMGEVLVHGVAMRPGKPVLLALVRTARGRLPLVGLPGYPVSAWLSFRLFVMPLLLEWQGRVVSAPPTEWAVLTRRLPGAPGFTEFVRVRVGRVGGRTVAVPQPRGAGVLTSLARAEGLLILKPDCEGVEAGTTLPVELLVDRAQLDGTVLAAGSHDLALDLLAAHLRAGSPEFTLASANVGSLAGLAALRRGEAHLAGVHLLDPATGEYNLSYVQRWGPAGRTLLVTLAWRQQGLLVAPANPLGITGLADLGRPDVTFVNRQRGAGTRVLLDYELERLRIDPQAIQGYDREEYSHLAVGAAVVSGAAGAGLGILAAAKALGLGFIPVTSERYELAIPAANLTHPGVRRLMEELEQQRFREAVAALGGYDTSHTGEQRWVEG